MFWLIAAGLLAWLAWRWYRRFFEAGRRQEPVVFEGEDP